jgi:transcriptional regulator with XRE-family HTH domain
MSQKHVNGESLRALRLRAGLTTKDLAEKCGVCESTIEGIEAGRRKYLSDATLIGLAKGLGKDPMDLEKEITVEVVA